MIENITIPENVETIETNAFYNCEKLNSIKIKRSNGSITGSPWGATRATVTWNYKGE